MAFQIPCIVCGQPRRLDPDHSIPQFDQLLFKYVEAAVQGGVVLNGLAHDGRIRLKVCQEPASTLGALETRNGAVKLSLYVVCSTKPT